jgi:hypothetical protein
MVAVDTTAELRTDASPAALFAEVDCLDDYPEWLEIVSQVVPTEPDEGDPGPAWLVELRAQLGPLRRSKRLRMVRSLHTAGERVEFVRRELDGRSHSEWKLTAVVTQAGSGSMLTMSLHYGGNLWVPMLEKLLRDEIERSRPRLVDRLAG